MFWPHTPRETPMSSEKPLYVNSSAAYKAIEARATAQAEEAATAAEEARKRLAQAGLPGATRERLDREYQMYSGWAIERAATALLKAGGK